MCIRVLSEFRRDRRGNIAIMYALSLPVLMFIVGAAIDFGHAAQVRTQLNAAADAAAFAALTPAMMQQSNATAQTAAENMFNGQVAAITSLAAGDTTVTVTVTNPNGNALIRNVTVTYSAQNDNMFAGFLGLPTTSVGGTSSATVSTAPNINFYLLLDNSSSMALPATQAGIDSMIALTPQQSDGGWDTGCAYACHELFTNDNHFGDTTGQSVRPNLRVDDYVHHPDAQLRQVGTRQLVSAPPGKGRKSTITSSRATTTSRCGSTSSPAPSVARAIC